MEFTVIPISTLEVYDYTSKKLTSHKGFAFIDNDGKTIIQCYGEGKRDLIKSMLENGE